ncbi:MAG: hypothetical protein AB8G11_16740 [Saprospiraceae bacterium]
MKHRTKDGKKIPLTELEDSHLMNIIAYQERMAKKGFKRSYGAMDEIGVDVYYSEEIIEGLPYLKESGHKYYLIEAFNRNLISNETMILKLLTIIL